MLRFVRRHPYRILAFVLACLVVAGAALLPTFGPEANISQASCDRIEPGMTEAEVEAIIGERGKGWIGTKSTKGKVWLDADSGILEVSFSRRKGRVVDKDFTPLPRRSLWQRIMRRLGLG
ncbi:MAG TPA: hypothetical protein VG013_25270 [Gemmataceae bacterium]|jgi:hypothetical protein|nr:hypothetical protein [Gemmataceae bacterium]